MQTLSEGVCQCASASRSFTPSNMAGTLLHRMTQGAGNDPAKAHPYGTPWLQHMLLYMQKYSYAIQYKPGKEMVLANCLSHFPSCKESLPIPVAQNVQYVQLSNAELDVI